MERILRIIFVTIAFTATVVSSFVPTHPRFDTFSRPFVALHAPSPSSTSSPPASTNLYAGPSVAEPKIKEGTKISKDAEKESSPSKSKGWAVRLYNDPMNKREFVARCLTEVCSLSDGAAYQCMMQAHQFGISVIGLYHLEMAELYRDQLTEHGLMIDMVPVDDDK